jgi:hypothetical protein
MTINAQIIDEAIPSMKIATDIKEGVNFSPHKDEFSTTFIN